MVTLACPSCGAEIPFRSSTSIYAVCSYCGSTVVRHDRDVQAIGSVADLPPEMTPLQVGSELTWRGTHYLLAGRLRIGWADGAWNEWYLVGGDQPGWLAEAQGFLSVLFPWASDPSGALPVLGQHVMLAQQRYRVTDIKEGTCLGSEGELPFRAERGRRATYVDLLDPTGGVAGIEDSSDGRTLTIGQAATFDRLTLRNLREVEGWKRPGQPPGAEDPLAA